MSRYVEKQDAIDAALDSGDVFPLARDYFAANRHERREWMAVFLALTSSARDRLQELARQYGTAAAIELKDALVEIQRR